MKFRRIMIWEPDVEMYDKHTEEISNLRFLAADGWDRSRFRNTTGVSIDGSGVKTPRRPFVHDCPASSNSTFSSTQPMVTRAVTPPWITCNPRANNTVPVDTCSGITTDGGSAISCGSCLASAYRPNKEVSRFRIEMMLSTVPTLRLSARLGT